VSDFPEKLRQAMHEKRCSSADIARATGISPSVLSRYLSGANKPSSDNILVISQYLNVTPEWLLSSSDTPEPLKKNQAISSATDPLLKIIAAQEELVKSLQTQLTAQSHFIHALFKELDGAKAKINPAFDRMNKADQNAAKATRKRKK